MRKFLYIAILLVSFWTTAEAKSNKDTLKIVTNDVDNIFLPTPDCYPDPVLDSISIENNTIYVEDHVMTTGELDYVMRKVNLPLYEKVKSGEKLYLFGALGTFVGTGMLCTGYYWKNNYSGSRKDVGKALFIAGLPVTAAGATLFTVGVTRCSSARRQFKRNCLGIAAVELGVGVDCFSMKATF